MARFSNNVAFLSTKIFQKSYKNVDKGDKTDTYLSRNVAVRGTKETDMEYNTPFRTTLRNDERDEIKRIANEKGMKLTGYVDYILRRAIEEERRSSGRKQ